MSVQSEITRLQNARNTIRTKMIDLGLAVSTDGLSELAEKIDDIANVGAVDVEIREGDTYTIPAGYHNGSGTVSGVAGGGNYTLQSKAGITPQKQEVSVTPDQGYYGLSSVTIDPIPDAYQDVTGVTAIAGNVLTGTSFVPASGVLTAGTMPNNGAVTRVLDAQTTSYTIVAGYHNGSGSVSIVLEQKTVTPSESTQTITPTSGKVMSQVVVAAIPEAYQDVTQVDAVAGDVLYGKKIVNAAGNVVTGSMANNGSVSATITGLGAVSGDTYVDIPAGYTSGGRISLTSDIETALAAI